MRYRTGAVIAIMSIGMWIIIGILAVTLLWLFPANANWQNVAAEWDQYQLTPTQRMWFKSVKNRQSVPCCDVADGHPTEMRRAADGGYQVPDPRAGHEGEWLDVPATALTVPRGNPIGVATVWYSMPVDGGDVYIRCFIPESET
jgi:hypothetical protein